MIQNLMQNSIDIIRKILMHSSKYITDLDSHNAIKYAILTQSKKKKNIGIKDVKSTLSKLSNLFHSNRHKNIINKTCKFK